jgi:hypothetical protein
MIRETVNDMKIVYRAGPEGRGFDDRKRPLMYKRFRHDIGRSSKLARTMYVAALMKHSLFSSSSSSLTQMSSNA